MFVEIGFLSHNFGSKYAIKPIKDSKGADFSLVSKRHEAKNGCWVDAQGQIKLAKNLKTSPLMTSPSDNSKRKSENLFKIGTRRPPECVEVLNSSLALAAGKL